MSTATRRSFFARILGLGVACSIAGCGQGTGEVAPTTDAAKNKHLQDLDEAKKKGASKKKA